jgi:glycine/D-amino acid oxidase-like deaminating enzyme
MRKRIIPTRGTMSAQKPPQFLRPLADTPITRSYTFYGKGYHYLTQLPTVGAELMFGGGVSHYGDEPGVADDAHYNPKFGANLAKVIPELFSAGVVADMNGAGKESERDGNSKERVEAVWTGIFALSADGMPWVGRLPPELTGRQAPVHTTGSTSGDNSGLTAPGEWLSGGYCGEGMVYAWRCGQAVAHMVLGKEVDWLPEAMLITKKRWRRESF